MSSEVFQALADICEDMAYLWRTFESQPEPTGREVAYRMEELSELKSRYDRLCAGLLP